MSGTYIRQEEYNKIKEGLNSGKYTVQEASYWEERSLGTVYAIKNTKNYADYQQKHQKRLLKKPQSDDSDAYVLEATPKKGFHSVKCDSCGKDFMTVWHFGGKNRLKKCEECDNIRHECLECSLKDERYGWVKEIQDDLKIINTRIQQIQSQIDALSYLIR